MRKRLSVLLPGLWLAGMGAATWAADQKPKLPEASIPFVKQDSIRDWQADGIDGIWIQDQHRDWFYARLLGPCHGLDFATGVAFDTGRSNTLDRFSYVIVPREDRCPFMSLVKSDPPPPKAKKGDKKAVEAQVGGG